MVQFNPKTLKRRKHELQYCATRHDKFTQTELASNSPWRVVTEFSNYALGKNLHFHSKTPI